MCLKEEVKNFGQNILETKRSLNRGKKFGRYIGFPSVQLQTVGGQQLLAFESGMGVGPLF